jgi:hypothetical protein
MKVDWDGDENVYPVFPGMKTVPETDGTELEIQASLLTDRSSIN